MLILHLLLFSSFMTVYAAIPGVSIPLKTQLPLIARVDQPYSWSFCIDTFSINTDTPSSNADTFILSTLPLPKWLSFVPETRTFHGTPSAQDEGNPEITVMATDPSDPSSSVSSVFNLCVTSYPPPILNRSLLDQFADADNPSLSSVFRLSMPSTPATAHIATLRIPSKWSFSIGFLFDTFLADNNLFYDVRRSDGGPIPGWMFFNTKALTVNGVTPSESITLSLALHASDQQGYTASTEPFDLVISSHDLSSNTSSLPTINVTASTPFNITLSSPADFTGIYGDGQPLQPSEVTDLAIDVSSCKDLKYDNASRTLSSSSEHGLSFGQNPLLPVTIVWCNQTIQTNVSLAVVPSYFLVSSLDPVQASPGDKFQYNLAQEYSNVTGYNHDVKLTAAYLPARVADWLHFDSANGQLTGTMPADFDATCTHITASFTAYSSITHSTSHTTLPIVVLSSTRNKKEFRGGLSTAAHKRLVLGLGIVFGIVGGVGLVGGLLAAFRRCARVEDTATGGEAGRNVWSDQDKRWYRLEKVMSFRSSSASVQPRSAPDYGHMGLGLRRISERSQAEPTSDVNSPGIRSPGVMSKREFLTRIRETVRIVSDKARRKPSNKRLIISKPILRSSQSQACHPSQPPVVDSPSNPFDRPSLPSRPGSTIMTNSPSTSTAEHSIPRRRADFAPPRSPAPAHLEDNRLSRQLSTRSTSSLGSNTSTRTHAAEAIVQTASKAVSTRGSDISHQTLEPTHTTGTRPRLVPFTSATRVPIPRRPSSPSLDVGSSTSKRVNSQTATVWKSGLPQTGNSNVANEIARSGSGDELRMGVHYVESLGEDDREVNHSTSDAPHQNNRSNSKNVARALVRIGEKFRFRVPVPPASPTLLRTRVLEVKLVSGEPLPEFMHVDMGEIAKGVVEVYGVPASPNLGEVGVGVYTSDGICVSQMILEVVKWR